MELRANEDKQVDKYSEHYMLKLLSCKLCAAQLVANVMQSKVEWR